MVKLNQIVAVEKGVKSRVYSELTALNKTAQKVELFNGFTKNYKKKDEDSEELPAETKKVQIKSQSLLNKVQTELDELIDVTARKEWSNTKARADIKVKGKVLFENVPVTCLLFLEKTLTDIRTLISNIPTLEHDNDWDLDKNTGLYKTSPQLTHRTKKMQKAIVLYDATPEHPAQTQLITEDVLAGYWESVKQSGALPEPMKELYLKRAEELIDAVKQAREEANLTDVEEVEGLSEALFDYLWGE